MSEIKKKMTFLMLFIIVVFVGCGKENEKQVMLQDDSVIQQELQTAQTPKYKTETAENGEYVKSKTGTAVVVYPLREELVWERNDDSIQEILVKRGQRVKKGDVLAVFEIQESRVEMETLKLQLLRKQEDFSEESAEKLKEIEDAKEAAPYHYLYRELDLENLRIEKLQIQYEQYVYQMEKEIAQLQEQITKLTEETKENTLKAPFDGVIDSVENIHPGDPTEAGKTLFTMYSMDKVVLEADNTSANLKYNMDVALKFSYRNEKKVFQGKVISTPEILPADVNGSRTIIQLTESVTEEDLMGEVTYQCNTELLQNVLLVDRDAVKKEDNKDYVYILQDGHLKKRFVVTGPYNVNEVMIADGLTAGQVLIKD